MAGAGLIAAPTGVGAAALEGAALGAATVSLLATGLKAGFQFYDGDNVGGLTTVGTAFIPGRAGAFASRLLGSAAVAGSRAERAVRVAGQAQGTAAGMTAEGIICGIAK